MKTMKRDVARTDAMARLARYYRGRIGETDIGQGFLANVREAMAETAAQNAYHGEPAGEEEETAGTRVPGMRTVDDGWAALFYDVREGKPGAYAKMVRNRTAVRAAAEAEDRRTEANVMAILAGSVAGQPEAPAPCGCESDGSWMCQDHATTEYRRARAAARFRRR